MTPKVKFCGLTRREDIACASELLPEYIGFVFAPKSRRYVSPAAARALKDALDARIAAVGVFVNEPPENVAALLRDGVIDMAQLHGSEDAGYIRRLRALTDRPLIQAFQVTRKADIEAAAESPADFILLDAARGGSGEVFDWTLLREFSRPFFLAGGLSPQNAAEASALGPYALDVSSGIETDGRKDPAKMRAFIEAVRGNKEGMT